MNIRRFITVALLLFFITQAHGQVPGIINYQGRVTVDGTNFDGTGQFKFALVDGTGATTYWSNGVTTVAVPVTKGLYSVLLGDTGMNPLSADIFTHSNVQLRVWFDNGITGFQQLSPDQRLGTVGYAFASANAFSWKVVTGATQQAVANTGYIITNSTTFAAVILPTTPSVGDVVRVSGPGAGGWMIAQNADQSVLAGNTALLCAGAIWTASESNRVWRSVASSSDGTRLVAVANGGQIYTSTDSGETWIPRENNRNWWSVASSADGDKLVAGVNNNGQIYTSTDSGTNWTARASSGNWVSVASSADGSKLVGVALYGQIYTSTDSGTNWTARESIRPWTSVASSSDGTKLVATASLGSKIYTSSDSGTNWTARDSNRNWTSVASSSDGSKLVAVVSGGQIYTSTNSGINWTARESIRSWRAVTSSTDGSKLAAVVNGGQVYTSTDLGMNWTPHESSQLWYSVASSSDGSKLIAVVENGQIYTSTPPSATPGATTAGTAGSLTGGQGSAIELQYIGNNQFMPISHEGTIFGY